MLAFISLMLPVLSLPHVPLSFLHRSVCATTEAIGRAVQRHCRDKLLPSIDETDQQQQQQQQQSHAADLNSPEYRHAAPGGSYQQQGVTLTKLDHVSAMVA